MSRVEVPFNHKTVDLRSAWRTPADLIAFPTQFIKFLLLPALLSLLLSACAYEGDFGRPHPTVFTNLTDEFLLNVDILSRGRVQTQFNRDEIVMREAGERMIRPLRFEPRPTNISYDAQLGGYGSGHWTESSENPIAFLAYQLNSDHRALTLFGEAARRVLASDSRHIDSVLKRDPGLRAQEKQATRIRMQENYEYIESVFEESAGRLKAYHYAIEDLRVSAPDVVVSEARGSLHHLRDRTASLNYELSNFFRAALARSDSIPIRPDPRVYAGDNPGMPYGPSPDPVLPYGGPPEGPPAYPLK